LVTVPVGILVYASQPRRRVNQAFLLLSSLVLGLWLLALGMASLPFSLEEVMFWIRQSSAVSALIPAAMNLLRLSILYPEQSPGRLLRKNTAWAVSALMAFSLCQSPGFLLSARLPEAGEVLATPFYGPVFPFYAAYFLISLGILFRLMAGDMRRVSGLPRTEVEYVVLGSVVSFALGVFFFLVPNLTGLTDLGAVLPFSVMTFTVITAYGIATQGILDSPYMMRRTLAYGVLFLYLSVLYMLVYVLSGNVLAHLNTAPSPLNHLAATLAVVLSVVPARGIIQGMANRLFISSPPVDSGKMLREAGQAMQALTTVRELTLQFQRLLRESVASTEIRIRFPGENPLSLYLPETMELAGEVPPFLTQYLEEDGGLVVRELLERKGHDAGIRRVRAEMAPLGHAAIALKHQGQLLGLVFLGPRASGGIYGRQEQDLVCGLCNVFTVALANANLYTEVRNSRIYTDTLLEQLVSGVLATENSGNGLITTCNREAARILGANMQGKTVLELPPPLRELFLNPDRDRQVELTDQGDGIRHLHVGAAKFNTHQGSPSGVLMVLHDITLMKAMEQHLRHSDRLASLGTLAAGMAHEIKNPLVTLKTFTQLLPERYEDPDFRETFNRLAGQEIDRINRLVEQLLRLARPSRPAMTPLRVHEVLAKILHLLQQQARQNQVLITPRFEARRDLVSGDPDHLHQALLNLFINAFDAMPGGGRLEIETACGDTAFTLRIEDSGPGIPSAELPYVFDPFHTTKETGTGLGLSIAYQILQEHQGGIEVTSPPDKGACFLITIPLQEEGLPT